MQVAPAAALLLCVSLRVSLAEHWEFVDPNSSPVDDAIDYKDPCKAGRVCFASSVQSWMIRVHVCVS